MLTNQEQMIFNWIKEQPSITQNAQVSHVLLFRFTSPTLLQRAQFWAVATF